MSSVTILASGLLLILLPTVGLTQARVQGTIRDSTHGTPLPLVEVLVEGMNLSTRTDAQGRYTLSIPLGIHTLRFRRVGYHAAARQLRLVNRDPVQLDLAMLIQAQRLDSVAVAVEAPPRTWPPGLDTRMKEGFGKFITDSTIRKFEHSSLSNMIQSRASGVRFKRMGGRSVIYSGRGGRPGIGEQRQDCFLAVWLDGMVLWEPGNYYRDPSNPLKGWQGEPPPDLDRFRTVALEAVEVYTVAQTPAQYRGSLSNICGVVLLWTRQQRQ
ncbi:MAG: carboxypeptidase-like regulatory domain-containing protein [Gemmatimonadota bacterium]|nr:carboxypeptidase-like regulatory domain-containing protein [Gemmatimonadota bacterium]